MKTFLFFVVFAIFCAEAEKVVKKSDKQVVVSNTNTTTPTPPANKTSSVPTPSTPAPSVAPPLDDQKPPTVDWGKCPQLEPKEADKASKAAVLESCLKSHPIPVNLTEESIESHQKQIAECALKKEKWFTKSGNYRYSKAESEIKAKKLPKVTERALLSHHKSCQSEAKDAFRDKKQLIQQIQLYQACMDFHITSTCGIRLKQ